MTADVRAKAGSWIGSAVSGVAGADVAWVAINIVGLFSGAEVSERLHLDALFEYVSVVLLALSMIGLLFTSRRYFRTRIALLLCRIALWGYCLLIAAMIAAAVWGGL